jgi:hypothetical protein
MPAELINRAADNWLPLLAIADAAAGDWPRRARAAAKAARMAIGDNEDWFELLLADIRNAFGDSEDMASADLVEALVAIEGLHGRRWARTESRSPRTDSPTGFGRSALQRARLDRAQPGSTATSAPISRRPLAVIFRRRGIPTRTLGLHAMK